MTLESLGLDPHTFHWQDLSACAGLDVNLFFDKYEKYRSIAEQTDNICLTCPVIADCFNFGQHNEETGVYGGFYLNRGEVDSVRNKHKSPEVVTLLSKRIFGEEDA